MVKKILYFIVSLVACVGFYWVSNSFALNLGKAWDKVKSSVSTVTKPVGKSLSDIGKEIEKTGGAVKDVGVTIGNVTIKEIAKTGGQVVDLGGNVGKVALDVGDVVVSGVGKTGQSVLKAGQAVVTSSGMTLLNVGGMVWAITQGDLSQFTDCAQAVYASAQYGVASVIDESLKVVGNIDLILKIDSFSFEGSAAQLSLQGSTPKVSIKGRFWGRDFELKDVQLNLGRPDMLIADIAQLLIQLKIGQ